MPNCLSVRCGLVCKNRGLRRFVWTASVRTADERTGETLSALRILRRLVFLLLAAPHRQTDMKSIQYRHELPVIWWICVSEDLSLIHI